MLNALAKGPGDIRPEGNTTGGAGREATDAKTLKGQVVQGGGVGHVGGQEGRDRGRTAGCGDHGQCSGNPYKAQPPLPQISGFTGTEVLPTFPFHPSPHIPRVKLAPWSVLCLYPDLGSHLLPPHRPALADFRMALRAGLGRPRRAKDAALPCPPLHLPKALPHFHPGQK